MKKDMCLIICIAILLVLLCIAPTPVSLEIKNYGSEIYFFNGNTLYVGGSGPGNYSSIQAAIENASEGDTVFVFDNSSPYFENVIINKTINLLGENRETTVIDGNNYKDVIYLDADGVNISGFTLQNDGGDWGDAGIEILSNNNTIFDNIIINNFYGFHLGRASNNKIISNIVTSCVRDAMFVNRFCHNTLLQDNTFSDNMGVLFLSENYDCIITGNTFSNTGYGLTLYSTRTTVIDNSLINCGLMVRTFNNVVKNNTVNGKPLVFLEDKSNIVVDEDCGQIILINSSNITIKNQDISNTSYPVILRYSNNCSIINSKVSDSKYGIYGYCSDDNIIANNTVTGHYYDGIFLFCCNNNFIRDNICSYNDGTVHINGIRLSDCDDNEILNNRCCKNGVGIACYDYSDNNVIEGNSLYDNRIHGIDLKIQSNNNLITRNNITDNYRAIRLEEVAFNRIINNNFLNNEYEIKFNIVYYYRLKLFRAVHLSGNYWGRPRIFPRFFLGDYTLVIYEAPYGGLSIPFRWIFIDWNPAKEPHNIIQ